MRKEEKTLEIQELKSKFDENQFFYITDSSALTVAQINKFRRICFEKGIEVKVVKNTLAMKALESFDESKNYASLYESLHGPTTLLFSDTANLPAKVIKEFRKTAEKPLIKAAYIDAGVYLGDDQLDILAKLKTKEELIGEIIGLLQSPAKNVIGALKSGGQTIAGLLKTLEERAN
ncbi:MAG: 50S ribosomal protein L10 [Saprospiraceae bacterium]|nr:50S ribosomal protein L10 [Saprospiraceae bacterium]MBK8633111.1 50S ribosomal protein L10 [Saprospiraceae bacterium]HMS69830.1 50S ribosomal protein L10 [Saprospiraceae bacterium]